MQTTLFICLHPRIGVERAEKLGEHQARPFATSGYTDDYELKFVSPELAVAGARGRSTKT